MGNNQSSKAIETPRGPPPRPNVPPSSRLLSDIGPKGPSYHNPENRVLPKVLPGMIQLRPVSQDLGSIHPDYKEIFAYDDDVDEGHSSLHDEVDNIEVLPNGRVRQHQPNGHVPNGILKHSDSASDTSSSGRGTSSDAQKRYRMHRRQQSASSSYYMKDPIMEEDMEERLEHRGKIDPLSSSCPHVSLPVKASFEIDSSLNLTYAQLAEKRRNKTLSMIEQKTGKRIEDLSDDLMEHAQSTPGPLLVRSASTKSARSNVSFASTESLYTKKKKKAPAPPTHAPPPPPTSPRSAPTTPRSKPRRMMSQPPPRPTSPPPVFRKGYSVGNEPPVDYDMESPRRSPIYQFKDQRTAPAAPPAPPPPVGILRNTNTKTNYASRHSAKKLASYRSPQTTPRENAAPSPYRSLPTSPRDGAQQMSFKSPPVLLPQAQTDPFLLEIQKLAETKAARRQLSEEQAETPRSVPQDIDDTPVETNDNYSIKKTDSSASFVFSSDSLPQKSSKPVLKRQESVKSDIDVDTIPPPPDFAGSPRRNTTVQRKPSTTSSSSAGSSNNEVRKLNSLLQHDIKLAAASKITKVTPRSTPVREKPEDPAEVFRKQLAKAAADRKSKQIDSKSIDDLMMQRKKSQEGGDSADSSDVEVTEISSGKSRTVLKTDSFVVKKKENVSRPKETITIDLDQEDTEFPRPPMIQGKSLNNIKPAGGIVKNSRQRLPEGVEPEKLMNGNANHQKMSEQWVPEDDLDSDDNLYDTEMITSRRDNSDGFKKTVVPSKVNELQNKSIGKKGKENKYLKKANDSQDEKRKFDSIKRFKKSVRSGVANAFGSISKAGGKILKNKHPVDHYFEEKFDPPTNWHLANSASMPDMKNKSNSLSSLEASKRNSFQSDKAYKYMVPNGYADHGHESSDEENEESSRKSVVFENGVDDSDESADEDLQQMKRAGVAYVSKKGQIVVLPEYQTVQVGKDGKVKNDNGGKAPKIFQKKKKFTYDATVRRKEREEKEKTITEDVKEKESQRELERKKEIETEQEIRKVREMEARERLQKLEAQAQIQQHFLQQQQQQQHHMLSAPPLPPPTGFQQGYNPIDYSQFLANTSLPQGSLNLPFGNQSVITAPVFNGVPNVSYNDISDYMRMMGVQPNAATTPQQYAYLLNSMNWSGQNIMMNPQMFPTKSSSQEYLDRERNQVFNSWVGPAKQQASKATIINTSQPASRSTTPRVQNGVASTDLNGHHTGVNRHQRTNIMINDNESDISDGLSPMKTDAAFTREAESLTNGVPLIHTAVDDDGGHRTKISITTPGYHRQPSITSVSR